MAAKTKTKVKVMYHDQEVDFTFVETFDALEIQRQLMDPEQIHIVIGDIVAHTGSVKKIVKVIEE